MEIQIKRINYRYSTTSDIIFSSLTWSSSSPEVIGILGVNGSGKSTLLRLLSGLIKPTSGEISIGGVSVDGISSVKETLCFVPENAKLFLVGPTLSKELQRLEISEQDSSNLLADSGLLHLVDKKLYTLSEGQRRLVAIWLAFQLERQIILLDEPTIGMDIRGKQLFGKLLKKAVNNGKTVIIASNDSRILPLLDRISIIQNKGITLDGSPNDILYVLENMSQLIPNQVVRLIISMADLGVKIPQFTNISELNGYLQHIDRGNS
ncbi:MAG: ATP-binding cassette domain-containing protein [Candidatus Hodarchaeales archaeon]